MSAVIADQQSSRSRRRPWRAMALAWGLAGLAAVAAATYPLASAQPAPNTWRISAGYVSTQTGQPPANPSEIIALVNDFRPHVLEINAGDTVEWTSVGLHSIAVGRDRLPPFDASGAPNFEVAIAKGGDAYDGSGVAQSGFLEGLATYSLRFTRVGEYQVIDDIHDMARPGLGMAMTVRVKPAGERLAMTPEQVQAAAFASLNADLATRALPLAVTQAAQGGMVILPNGQTANVVSAGFGDGLIEGVRYGPGHLVVRAGDWVNWNNPDPAVPHTVTLLPGGGLPDFNTPPPDDLNPFVSMGGNVYDGSNMINLAVIRNSHMQAPGVTASGAIRFTTPGEYTYFCIFHAETGMLGKVTVLP